jgi:hypothetical protein
MNPGSSDLLATMLYVAVHNEIPHIAKLPFSRRKFLIEKTPDLISEKGDILMYGGGKKGEVAQIFARIAEGLAALALQPGGVKFGDHTYDACPKCAAPVDTRSQYPDKERPCHRCGHDLCVAYYPEEP